VFVPACLHCRHTVPTVIVVVAGFCVARIRRRHHHPRHIPFIRPRLHSSRCVCLPGTAPSTPRVNLRHSRFKQQYIIYYSLLKLLLFDDESVAGAAAAATWRNKSVHARLPSHSTHSVARSTEFIAVLTSKQSRKPIRLRLRRLCP
jgi:hypothetical protein